MYSYEILHIHRPASNSRYLDHLESIEPYFCMFDVPKHHVDYRNLNLISPWVELLSFLKISKKMITSHHPIGISKCGRPAFFCGHCQSAGSSTPSCGSCTFASIGQKNSNYLSRIVESA